MKTKIVPREKSIPGIKYSLYRMEPTLSTTEKIESIIMLNLHYFDLTCKKEYLQWAVDHIEAYLRLGYKYEELGDLFDKVLKELEISREEIFPDKVYRYIQTNANKAQVNRVLGRWAPVVGGIHKEEAINDILKHILNKEIGEYNYCSRLSNFELMVKPYGIYGCSNNGVEEVYYEFVVKEPKAKEPKAKEQ